MDEWRAIGWPRLTLALLAMGGMSVLALWANDAGPFTQPQPPMRVARISGSAERMAQAPAIAGRWQDDRGYAYAFEQIGDRYSFRLLRAGRDVGGGAGRILGHNLVHDFTSRGGTGSCTGTIDATATRITATCHKGERALPFVLRRMRG